MADELIILSMVKHWKSLTKTMLMENGHIRGIKLFKTDNEFL